MPDRDPLQQLASFGAGGPVDPLPATEVRRRGDRRRARRTAVTGVVGAVAVLAVALPAGLYAARDGGGRSAPPASSTSAPTPLRTTIPADFPILAGIDPAPESAAVEDGPGNLADVRICGRSVWPASALDRRAATLPGEESSPTWSRDLLLFPTVSGAESAVRALASGLDRCPSEELVEPALGGRTVDYLHVRVDHDVAGADQTLTWTDDFADGGHDGAITQVVRVGNALAATRIAGTGTAYPPEELPTNAPSVDLVRAMRIFASPESPETAPAKVTEIAADFPLADGFPAQSELGADGYAGPNRTIDPVAIEACGARLPDPGHRDRLLARYESAEDYRTRQLTTYADADAAVAASRAFVEAFGRCPVDPRPDDAGYVSEREVQDLSLGGESWALLDRATMDGHATPFGSTALVVRVGRAVLIEEQTGHAGYPSARGVTELGDRLATPIAAMCAFTVAGCGSSATGAADCTAADLRPGAGSAGAAAGTLFVELRFTNTSRTACALHGASSLQAVTADGRRVPGEGSNAEAFTLPPGKYASVAVRDSQPANYPAGDCRPATVAAWRITLPGSGERIDVPALPGTRTCTKAPHVSLEQWQPVLDGH